MASRAVSPAPESPPSPEIFDLATPTTTVQMDAPHAAVDVPNPDVAASPPGISADEPARVPLIPPPIPTTISEANFQRMIDFWQEVSNRQEKRIEDLVQELKEIKKKDDKEQDDKGKGKGKKG